MASKAIIQIKENIKKITDYRCFDFDFEIPSISRPGWYTSGISFLNNNGYLDRIIDALKGEDKIYYLFSSFSAEYFEETKKAIDNVVPLCLAHGTIFRQASKNLLFFTKIGKEIRFFVINNQNYFKMVVSGLFRSWSDHVLVFDRELNKEDVLSKFKNLTDVNIKNIDSSFEDIVLFGMGCCSGEENLQIFTKRFDKNQIRDIVLSSVENEKIEVILK